MYDVCKYAICCSIIFLVFATASHLCLFNTLIMIKLEKARKERTRGHPHTYNHLTIINKYSHLHLSIYSINEIAHNSDSQECKVHTN